MCVCMHTPIFALILLLTMECLLIRIRSTYIVNTHCTILYIVQCTMHCVQFKDQYTYTIVRLVYNTPYILQSIHYSELYIYI